MNRAYITYIFALLLFGSNGVVVARISLSSYEIVLLRTLIGSVFLVIVLLLGRQKLDLWKQKRQLGYLAVSGAAMGVSWMLLFEAYNQVGVSVATLAYYCGPVIVMALSPLVFGECMTWIKIMGFVAVCIGMVLVNGQDVLAEGISRGLLYGIMAAAMYAVMVIFNKRAKDIVGLTNATLQLAVAFLVVLAFHLLTRAGSIAISWENALPVLFLGVVNTGIGCYWYFSSIQRLSAQSVSIWGYLEPLSALVFSALFLGEQLSMPQIFGAALILAGAAWGELYKGSKGGKSGEKA